MILPGATLGVLGGGQLARMFALRARVMGYRVVVLEPSPRSPAGAVADHQIEAAYDDAEALRDLAEQCAAVTTEFENVPAAALRELAEHMPVSPGADAVEIAQDRIAEKQHLLRAGFATAAFVPIRSAAEAEAAFRSIGRTGILKTSRLGYDGKGQAVVEDAAACAAAFESFGGADCVLEERLDLELELSVVLARGADGTVAAFPAGENRHVRGILETTVVPARAPSRLIAEAGSVAAGVAESLGYVGVMGVELFVSRGAILVNEIAPRPHNSGHYTIDACASDQFEQQVRAMCGLPLAEPRLLTPVAMINLLGDLWDAGPPRWDRALAMPGVRLHLYGKSEPRPGRKMGHLTCVAGNADEAFALAHRARNALTGA